MQRSCIRIKSHILEMQLVLSLLLFMFSLSKREILAFKAGSWASLPVDYIVENYAIPYAEKNFSEEAFYKKVSQFGSKGVSTSSRNSTKSKSSFKGKSQGMKMAAKRKYSNSTYALNKRLRRVEARSKAEMKQVTWSSIGTVTNGTINVLDVTTMAQGTANDQRIGDKIKVWRVEIRGNAGTQLDHYLIQKHGTVNPVLADFGTANYAFIDGDSLAQFTEWLSIKNLFIGSTGTANHREVLKFPKGIVVNYEGPGTAPVDNGLLFVSRNGTTTDYGQSFSIRVWYTDV